MHDSGGNQTASARPVSGQARAIDLTFELTEADVAALCRHAAKGRRGEAGCLAGIGTFLIVCGAFLICVMMLGLLVEGGTNHIESILTGIGVIVAGTLLRWGDVWLRLTTLPPSPRGVLDRGYGKLSLREHTVRLTPERFEVSTELSEMSTKWIGVFSIAVSGDSQHAFVHTSPSTAVIIPARAFASPEAFNQCVEQMQAWRAEAPQLESRCPACRYDLRSSEQIGCPECGWGR